MPGYASRTTPLFFCIKNKKHPRYFSSSVLLGCHHTMIFRLPGDFVNLNCLYKLINSSLASSDMSAITWRLLTHDSVCALARDTDILHPLGGAELSPIGKNCLVISFDWIFNFWSIMRDGSEFIWPTSIKRVVEKNID